MSSYLQNMKDFAANHLSAVGLSAAVGVVLYYTLSHCPSYKKIRPRSVSPADYSELANNQTLMAKYLTPDVYAKIKGKTTPRCFSLYALIQCGIENPFNPGGKSSGLLTGDQECYEVFNELLEPVIRELHGVRGSEIAVRTDMNWHKLKGGNIIMANNRVTLASGVKFGPPRSNLISRKFAKFHPNLTRIARFCSLIYHFLEMYGRIVKLQSLWVLFVPK